MASFPGALASFVGFIASHTLSADSHAAQHNLEQAEILAAQTKIGTGSSTPTSARLLRGSGTGTSAWAQADLTTDVTGVLPQANGGTGTTLATGTGKAVYDTSPTVSNPTISGGGSWAGSPTLTSPIIADHTNAAHTHATTAQGGQLNAANALTAATLPASVMKYGMVRNRQGGTTGDASWNSGGTSNTDTSAKDIFIQAGRAATSGDTTVTFPTAYSQVPIVIMTTAQASGFNTWAEVLSVTTTTFTYRQVDDGGASRSEQAFWMAIGQ